MTLKTGVIAAKTSAMHYRNKLYFKIQRKVTFSCNNFIRFFDEINAPLVNIRHLLKKHFKLLNINHLYCKNVN